jgi:hypothetical protein
MPMRASLVVWCVVAFAGCRSDAEPAPPRSNPPPPITATPETSAPLSATPAPTSSTETPPPSLGAPIDGGKCQKDSDCAVTRVPDGDCCPMLCTPRGVTAAESRRIEERVRQCEAESRPCRAPACMPKALRPACVGGTCTAVRAESD